MFAWARWLRMMKLNEMNLNIRRDGALYSEKWRKKIRKNRQMYNIRINKKRNMTIQSKIKQNYDNASMSARSWAGKKMLRSWAHGDYERDRERICFLAIYPAYSF